MINLKMYDDHTCQVETDVTGHFAKAPDLKAFLIACSLDAQAALWAALHSITEDAVKKIDETSSLTEQEKEYLRKKLFEMTVEGLTPDHFDDFKSELREC